MPRPASRGRVAEKEGVYVYACVFETVEKRLATQLFFRECCGQIARARAREREREREIFGE